MNKELYSELDRALLKYASKKAEICKNTYQLYRDIWRSVIRKASEAENDEELIVTVVEVAKVISPESENIYKAAVTPVIEEKKVIDINYLFKLLNLYKFGLPGLKNFKQEFYSDITSCHSLQVTATIKTLREIKKQQEELLNRALKRKMIQKM